MPEYTEKEQYKLSIINKAIAHEITNGQAAKRLQLSVRQIKRLKQQVKRLGEKAIVHKLKGEKSNHHIDDVVIPTFHEFAKS